MVAVRVPFGEGRAEESPDFIGRDAPRGHREVTESATESKPPRTCFFLTKRPRSANAALQRLFQSSFRKKQVRGKGERVRPGINRA